MDDFRLEDYVKLYWIAYYNVRAEYFPNDSWRKYYNDKSPDIWTSNVMGSGTYLGRELFNRGAKLIYKNLTYYSERKTNRIPIDDNFLVLVFCKIGCIISDEEKTAKSIESYDLPKELLKLLDERYPQYLKDYPDLQKAVDKSLEDISQKIGINIQIEKVKAEDISKKTVAVVKNPNKILKPTIQNESGYTLQDASEKQIITDTIIKYYNFLHYHDFSNAWSMIYQNDKNQSVLGYQDFKNGYLWMMGIRNDRIFDINVYRGERADCLVVIEEGLDIYEAVEDLKLDGKFKDNFRTVGMLTEQLAFITDKPLDSSHTAKNFDFTILRSFKNQLENILSEKGDQLPLPRPVVSAQWKLVTWFVRFYRFNLIKQNDEWRIEYILPVQYYK